MVRHPPVFVHGRSRACSRIIYKQQSPGHRPTVLDQKCARHGGWCNILRPTADGSRQNHHKDGYHGTHLLHGCAFPGARRASTGLRTPLAPAFGTDSDRYGSKKILLRLPSLLRSNINSAMVSLCVEPHQLPATLTSRSCPSPREKL